MRFDRNNLGNNRIVILLMVSVILFVMLFVSRQNAAAAATTNSKTQNTNPAKPKPPTKKPSDKEAFAVTFTNNTWKPDSELTEYFNISRISRRNSKVIRNISLVKYYSGLWETEDHSSSPRKRSKDFVAGNHGKFYVGQLKILQHKGNTMGSSDTIVGGSIMVRDGVHSTDATLEYVAKGSYFWKLGTVLLFGCTTYRAPNITFVAPPDTNTSWFVSTFMSDSFKFMDAEVKKAAVKAKIKDICPLRVVLKVNSLYDDKEVRKFAEKKRAEKDKARKIDDILSEDAILIDGAMKYVNDTNTFKIQGGVYSTHDIYVKARYFAVFFILLGLLEYVLSFRQINSNSSLAALSKISSKTIGFQCILDVYISIFIFVVASNFSQSIFFELAAAAFIYFTKFSFCDMRYLVSVWKASNPAAFNNGDQMRRKFMLVYVKIYTLFFVCILLVYFINNALYYLTLVAYSMWVPQIIKNIYDDTYGPFSWHYIIGMSFSRSFVPLYFLSTQDNFLSIKENKLFGTFLVLYLILQIVGLLVQKKCGSRFFVPKKMHPQKYDYHREIPPEVLAQASNGRLECLICMEHVHVPQEDRMPPEVQLEEGNGGMEGDESENGPYVITPCNHIYHENCLSHWLECKLECPACRTTIPPL